MASKSKWYVSENWKHRLEHLDQYDISDKDEFNAKQLSEMCGCSITTIYNAIGRNGKIRYTKKEFVTKVKKYVFQCLVPKELQKNDKG
jgi:hypothetical protein